MNDGHPDKRGHHAWAELLHKFVLDNNIISD